jgi:glycosyltransferase involved in cell wall biosynthesis
MTASDSGDSDAWGSEQATLPVISIVTPSLNQARYLEQAIESVLGQGYPRLEYVICDGGSSDGSREIIERHSDRLTWWRSEKDEGHYASVNDGFARTSGEVMAWLNSDDRYLPGALRAVGEIFARFPSVDWLTSLLPVTLNEQGVAVGAFHVGGFSRKSFLRGANLPRPGHYARSFVQQESTFWRRRLWDKAGGALDTGLAHAADYELWTRFFQHAELVGVEALIGGFRVHDDQRSSLELRNYLSEAESTYRQRGGSDYDQAESLLRAAVWQTLGRRSSRRLPSVLIKPLARVGLFDRTANCVWNGADWELVTDYVV